MTGRAAEAWTRHDVDENLTVIANDTVYIHALEAGSSPQAPDGILDSAVGRAQRAGDKALAKLLDPLGSI